MLTEVPPKTQKNIHFTDISSRHTFISDVHVEQSLLFQSPSVAIPHFKKSRRTNRKYDKKTWKPKNTPTAWTYLAQQSNWNKLPKDMKMQLMLGWPKRYFCLSYQEISDALDISLQAAKRKIHKWERVGDITKKKSFLKRRGRVTGLYKRNYYVLTKKRKKEIKATIQSLFETAKTEPLKDSSKEENFCQAKRAISFEEVEESEYHKFLEKRFDQLLAEEEPLKQGIVTLFGMSGFESQISTLPSWLKKLINARPVKELVANLKWHEKKRKKGYRIRNFWASFVWRMKLGKDPISWMTKRANDYKSAIERKMEMPEIDQKCLTPNGTETYVKESHIEGCNLMSGVDSAEVVEQIVKLQKKTGLVACKRELHGLLCYGASHLRSLIKVVLFKSKRKPLRNWIGYVHFLAKKPIVELSNMYKSEEQIQEKCDAEAVLLRRSENHRSASAWDRLLGDLEEGDRVFATGTGGEIWD